MTPLQIVVIEDNKADVFLIREAIQMAEIEAELRVVPDGEKAVRLFDQIESDDSAECPALVIIDINLPKKHGGEVLQHMRMNRKCGGAPVLVVTSSDSARDRETMARLGISGYFRKPSEFDDFMKLGELARDVIRQTQRRHA